MKPNPKGARLVILLSLIACSSLNAALPVVSNVRGSQRAGTQLVDIYYDLADPDSPVLAVVVAASSNGGATYDLPAISFSGALGSNVMPGAGKHVTWNAGQDWPNMYSANVRFRVTASDDMAPTSMAFIPAGSFQMGDSLDGNAVVDFSALPVHTVNVEAFYMDKYEVTKTMWDEVYQWATNHGYSFENGAQGKANNHPVHSMTWYDAVKWCNARSEKEGRVPAYYSDAALTAVYRSGQTNVQNDWVKWNEGYRLPTEGEWEKAARGGASGRRFPWADADTITHSRANYYSSGIVFHSYDTSPTSGLHPTFNDGAYPYTSPAGYFAANGFGLHDMAGNVCEWCWDWVEDSYYWMSPWNDPRGPESGSSRSVRDGSWDNGAFVCRTAYRNAGMPGDRYRFLGFRSVLPPSDFLIITSNPKRRLVRIGSSTTLSVTATGALPLYFQWQKDGINIPDATAASLILRNCQRIDTGTYSATVSNGAGSTTSLGALLRVITSGIGEF